MAIDAGDYIIWTPPAVATAAAFTSVTAAALDAATVCWALATEELDVYEVGCFITVTTGANTFAFTFGKRQTMGGADTVLCTATGPAAAAIAVDRFLVRQHGFNPTTGVLDPSWHFNKGDLLKFTVSDTSAAGGKGLFYAKCSPTGGVPTATKIISGTTTPVDVVSTT